MEPSGEPNRHGHGGISIAAAAASARTTCAAHFARLLHERGLHHALGYLNERTRYRFTALYRAVPPMLHTVGLFDRENPAVAGTGATSMLEETYCAITCDTAKPFVTMDASHDIRLEHHAARDSILCYAGVPVRLDSGRPWGSICHFDLRPRLLLDDELGTLATVAQVVAEWLGSCDPARA